ncbi:hypothetical protein [Nonomuraea typhae]|uniref:hypothetical protein n=1 Tax=Nonomuraea typhae TaxID=2603600 RepID=UPI0012F91234|nr:hypothetical protein [Nonomuraea typhae]
MTAQIAAAWALIGLVTTIVLALAAGRIGRERAAAWLVVLGLVLLAVEEPLLTLFWSVIGPRADRDGMATLVTELARAHVLDSAALAAGLLVLLGWIAMTAFRRGERWAAGVLAVAWAVVAATVLTTTLAVHGRGLPIGPGSGFGWEQLGAGLLAWATGLWLVRGRAAGARPRTTGQGPS